MFRRARLVLAPAIALAVVVILLSLIPAPAAAFPTRSMYDRILAAPGVGPIAAGDLNGDGLTDIVSVDDRAGMYDVFLQTPSGLPGAPTMTFQGPGSRQVAIADMDGDGRNDIVSFGANSTTIFYQDLGSFGTRVAVVPTSGTQLVIGDLNGDGWKDIATLTSGAVQIWLQNLTRGTWPASPSVNITASGYHDFVAADLRNDGLVDLVLGKPFEVHLFPQTPGRLDPAGTSMFVATFNGSATVSLDVAKMDGDGMPDIVLAAVDSTLGYGELSVYLQRGDSFNLSTKLSGSFTGVFAVGDLNDDGRLDIAAAMHDRVTTTDTIAVFLQRFSGGFDATPTFQLSVDGLGGASGIAIGRFSGRPFYDLAARRQGAVLVYHQEDLSPVMIRAIPSDVGFNVGASGAALLDLRNYFSDDHGVLHFVVVYEENPAFLHATIAADGHHLDFTAAAGQFGSARFQVLASDGVIGNQGVRSNVFSVIVNAIPSFTSPPPTHVRAGEKLLYQVTVADAYPAQDVHTFSLLEAPAGMTIDGTTGLVEWTPTAADAGVHAVRIKVADGHGGVAEQDFSVEVLVGPAPPPTTAVVAATTLGAITALAAAALASENVKWSLLMIFIPLYSKIKREQVLDHFVRGQIYGYVLANPGEHYNAIKLALSLTNGSLAHHLKTLEREQFIKSKRFGLYRRFYPMNMKIPEDGFFTPNEIQKTIVDLIRATPAITQKEIAERLGLTPPTVNYHVGILSEHKAIRVERAGRKTHCFVVEGGAAPGSSTPSGGPATPGPSAPRPPL